MRLSILPFFIISVSLFACKEKHTGNYDKIYSATHKTDTATLALTKMGDVFFGTYEINKSGIEKDSGQVRGKIFGDTLKGIFSYVSSYNKQLKKTKPIALLMANNKLLLGKGVTVVYMKIPYYAPEVPIDFSNPEFVFEEVGKF